MIVLKICFLIKVKEIEMMMKIDCILYYLLKIFIVILFWLKRVWEEFGESNEIVEGLERVNNFYVKFIFVENGGWMEFVVLEENFFNDFDYFYGWLLRCKWIDCWRYYFGIFL